MTHLMNFGIDAEVADNTARIRDTFLRNNTQGILAAVSAINKKMNPNYSVTYRK